MGYLNEPIQGGRDCMIVWWVGTVVGGWVWQCVHGGTVCACGGQCVRVGGFGLTVSIKKTEVLRQLAPNTTRPPPNIFMDGNLLNNVDTFKYLGSCINSAANLDDEILCRISRASQAFGRLHTKAWHEQGISTRTKLSVFRAVVLPSLLYGCQTWTCICQ